MLTPALGAALAAGLAVHSPSIAEEEVAEAFARRGLPVPEAITSDELVDRVRLVSVTRREGDEDCGGPVGLTDWRARLDAARQRLQLLDFEAALSGFVALELEAACLVAAPSASDLFRVELSVAEAHVFLARAAGRDVGAARFHGAEADAALARAAAFGEGLASPADLDPDVAAVWAEVRGRLKAEDRPIVVVAGPGARVGARLNGRPLANGAIVAVSGGNLVQSSDGSRVTAAAMVPLGAGSRTVVWLAPGEGGRDTGDVLLAVGELARGEDADEALLAAVGRAAASEAWFVGRREGEVVLWEARGEALAEVVVASRRPVRDATPASEPGARAMSAGVAWAVGWSGLHGDELDGMSGGNTGPVLFSRVQVRDRWYAAFTLHPAANWTPLPAELGGGTLWRATVPVRAGARWLVTDAPVRPEVGLDLGVQFLGCYADEDGCTQRMSGLAVAEGGVALPSGDHAAFRAQAFAGVGAGYALLGGYVGFEARP
jgi:hypothetical protein